MAKDTVRYPDSVVAAIDERVEDGVFESKSEFYRFAAEYVLTLLSEAYEPQTFAFEELRRELGVDEQRRADADDAADPFLATAAAVRQAALRGDAERAVDLIDERYDPTDREALLLDELLATYGARREAGARPARVEVEGDANAGGPAARGTTDGGRPAEGDGERDPERAEPPARLD
ncbi:MAG: CopG family transcriptional regulator [Haloferacaceae archaeon]